MLHTPIAPANTHTPRKVFHPSRFSLSENNLGLSESCLTLQLSIGKEWLVRGERVGNGVESGQQGQQNQFLTPGKCSPLSTLLPFIYIFFSSAKAFRSSQMQILSAESLIHGLCDLE